ncbi:hypothetical protein CPC08DRAFT_623611, partial [Agrocybe pediades]
APLSEYAVYLVVDTNILLHPFEVLSQFVDDVEKLSLPVIVIVPGAVVLELDRQKNRKDLSMYARRATNWLLARIKERKLVKGQAQDETCKSTGNWKIMEPGEISTGDMYNDTLILDCCMFYSRIQRTVLCSADKNLCIISQTQGIPTISPSPHWSSREIAQSLYGDMIVNPSQFAGHKESYRGSAWDPKAPGNSETTAAAQSQDRNGDAGMVIDSKNNDPWNNSKESNLGDSNTTTWQSEHPINMLHVAVIDHFSRLLTELVGRVGGDEVSGTDLNASQHAPQTQRRRKHYTQWSVAECVEYLTEKRKVKLVNPRPEVFLLKAYTRGVAGSRPGKDWSRQDWRMAMANLKAISDAWNDISMTESLLQLEQHVDNVFSVPLRGI